MDCHGVNKKGSLWVFNLQPNMFQGVQLDYFNGEIIMLCEIGQQICGGGVIIR